jgi:DNA-binding transcriptional regulator YhcF (GntR family)
MPRRNGVSADHLYLQVADGIEKMIGEEILRIGDKLPSVRVLSEEYGISMGTAFQAYYHLEGKGLVEASRAIMFGSIFAGCRACREWPMPERWPVTSVLWK